MRRKIIAGLVAHTLLLLAAGLYLATTIGTATRHVELVIQRHQVADLREDFLLRLDAVQADLLREGAAFAETRGAHMGNVEQVTAAIDGCFACHHGPEVTAQLAALREGTERYRFSLSTLPAGDGDGARQRARAAAYELGEHLVLQVATMIDGAHARVNDHTLAALRVVARTRWVAYALVVAGVLLSGGLGFVALTGLTRPLSTLVEATRRLEAGDLDHRVKGLHDEFEVLAHSFNQMASSLKEQLQLMQRTEQLVVVGELAAGLVHEIKNPLAGIKAATQVLAREASLSDEDREVLVKVTREVVGLEALLRTFLGFTKPARPQLSTVDLNEFVETVAAFYLRSHVARPEQPLRLVKVLGEVPPVRADPMQLQQIVLNLLLNATDAMPTGGVVELRTAYDPLRGEAWVEVADSGRGIGPEHAPFVFQPFFTTKPGGTGLGLAVSKRLAEHHGGALSFAPAPGGGTVFRLTLPAASEPARRSA